jgi:hypothetical protein
MQSRIKPSVSLASAENHFRSQDASLPTKLDTSFPARGAYIHKKTTKPKSLHPTIFLRTTASSFVVAAEESTLIPFTPILFIHAILFFGNSIHPVLEFETSLHSRWIVPQQTPTFLAQHNPPIPGTLTPILFPTNYRPYKFVSHGSRQIDVTHLIS